MVEGRITPNSGHFQPQSNPRGAATAESSFLSQSLLTESLCLFRIDLNAELPCLKMDKVRKLFSSHEAASLFINGNEIDTGKLIMLRMVDTQNLNSVFCMLFWAYIESYDAGAQKFKSQSVNNLLTFNKFLISLYLSQKCEEVAFLVNRFEISC